MNIWLKDYIGIPFENKGRGATCDCWGLVRRIYQEQFCISLPSFVDEYSNALDREDIHTVVGYEKEHPFWEKIEKGREEFGDMVIFNIGNLPVHVGLVTTHNRMLHVEKGINSCLEHYNKMRWRNRLEGFYRHKERYASRTY